MFENIHQFLTHHPALRNSDRMLRATFCEVVKEVCGVDVMLRETTLSGHTLLLTTRPMVKQEILLHKAALLRALRARLAERAPRDIR